MKTHYAEYLKEMLNNYSNDYNMDGRILFMRHYSSFGVNKDELVQLIETSGIECYFLYHVFKPNKIQSPYEPILDWIRNIYSGKTEREIEDMMDAAQVYSLHKPIIRTYISNGISKREESLIISEISYEKERFLRSVVNIVNYIAKSRPVIMVLHKIHFAQKSTIDFLMEFVKIRNGNISILAGYNETYSVNGYMQPIWDEFARYIELENIVVESGLDDGIQYGESSETFIPDIDELKEYIQKISNLNTMLAFDEALYYISSIYHRFLVEEFDIEENNIKDILVLYSYTAACLGNMKSAFLMCKKLSDMECFENDLNIRYMYYYLAALIKGNDRQREQSYPYIDKCKEIAVELNDKGKMFDAELLRCVVWHGGWRDVFVWDKRLDVDTEFLKEAENKKQYNHLAYIYFFGFIGVIDSNDKKTNYIGCENSVYFRKGMDFAKKVGNTECILKAWQKQIVYASSNGKVEEIEYYYNNCLKISREQDNKYGEANIYNGLAYSYIINEKFDLADKYLKKSINILLEIKKPEMIMETLYNMAINALAVENYEVVISYIKIVLKMLKALRMERMRICNISKLYGLLTVSYIKTGRIYDAKLYIDRIKRVLRHLLDENIEPDYKYWEDDIFLYYMIEGMLSREEGNYDAAREAFQKDIYLWTEFDAKQEYIFTQFIIEAVELYENISDDKKRNELLDIGIRFCDKNKYSYQKSRLENLKSGIIVKWEKRDAVDMSLPERIMYDINELTLKKGMEIDLEEKVKALMFFEAWVDLINRENVPLDVMMENAMTMMQNTYNLDSILWIDARKEQPVIKYCDKHSSITLNQAKSIIEYFGSRRKKIVVTRNDKSFDANKELIGIFGSNNISSFAGIPIMVKEQVTNILIVMRVKHMNFISNSNALTEEDANIFRTTFRQLIDAESRERFRIKLEQSSITDTLTGILNRQGLKQFLENQFSQDMNKSTIFTVLYMDLDNFKYCNDNFGHDVGDVILVSFSKMLKGIVKNSGKIIRYGGDEFVVVLPEFEVEQGIEIAESIFDRLETNKGFKQEIETSLNKKVNVDKSNRLSCSIGIATGECRDLDDILKILKKADEALYKVKRTTKHDYEVNI
ncbi:MAG: GGDEF domain-containing protein [Lachnospiraceae bacterium]|nr:GGDEF domain-containing protein [Lachnospiraceae bacterium]